MNKSVQGTIDSSSGKTIKKCPDCKTLMTLMVCQSQAGYYLGLQCLCGPYSRESGYFKNRLLAEKVLEYEKKN